MKTYSLKVVTGYYNQMSYKYSPFILITKKTPAGDKTVARLAFVAESYYRIKEDFKNDYREVLREAKVIVKALNEAEK